jgi:hypothetical protein
LSPGREYTVKVAAKNAMGVGRNTTFNIVTSQELHLENNKTRPQIRVPSGPARSISVDRISNTALQVTWESPDHANTNPVDSITGYSAVVGLNNCSNEAQIWTVRSTVNEVTFDNLRPGGKYCVRIYPINKHGPALEETVQAFDQVINFPNLVVCKIAKTEHPSFHYGEDGVTFLYKAQWNINRCQISQPMEGMECLPSQSKFTSLPFQCNELKGQRKKRIELMVPKDTQCHLVRVDKS